VQQLGGEHRKAILATLALLERRALEHRVRDRLAATGPMRQRSSITCADRLIENRQGGDGIPAVNGFVLVDGVASRAIPCHIAVTETTYAPGRDWSLSALKILVGIAALWALRFLNLALALPREFARPTDPDDDAAEPKIQPAKPAIRSQLRCRIAECGDVPSSGLVL
jgi:hypothetical protein